MTKEDNRPLDQRIEEGLIMAHKQMLKEKALHDQVVVIYDTDLGGVVNVPAQKMLEEVYPEETR